MALDKEENEGHSQPASSNATTHNGTDTDTAPPAAPAEKATEHVFPTGVKLVSILAAITTTYFLSFFDISVISTVTPSITSEFRSLVDVGWYSSAYTLASSSFQPLSGNIYRHFSTKVGHLTDSRNCLLSLLTVCLYSGPSSSSSSSSRSVRPYAGPHSRPRCSSLVVPLPAWAPRASSPAMLRLLRASCR